MNCSTRRSARRAAAPTIALALLLRAATGAQAQEPATNEPAQSEPEPEPELMPVLPVPAPTADLEPEAEALQARKLRWAVHRNAGASYGDLPGFGPVVQLGLALIWKTARLELDAHFGALRTARPDTTRSADLRAGLAILRGCGVLHYRPRKLEFPLCAGMEAGALFGRGISGSISAPGSAPWVAMDLNVGLVWAAHENMAVGWIAEPWVALYNPGFSVGNLGELWRPSPVGVRLVASVETRF